MYVVAGASGHVGSVVARDLLARGQKVKVIVRDPAKGTAWSKQGAEVAVGALDDAGFLTGALKGATGFFTLLPPNHDVDMYGTQNRTSDAIATAVKASGVPHVVILSSVGADIDHSNGPIKGLHYLENKLRATGVKLTAIRAGYFQENIGNSLAPAQHMGIFPCFTASADYPMPMIATHDIGALAAKSLQSPPARSEVVDLQGPAYSIRQCAEMLGKALGKTLQVVEVPQAEWIPAMLKGGMPQHLAESYAEMYAGFGSGAIQPRGDRMVQGTTTLDTVVKTLVP